MSNEEVTEKIGDISPRRAALFELARGAFTTGGFGIIALHLIFAELGEVKHQLSQANGALAIRIDRIEDRLNVLADKLRNVEVEVHQRDGARK